MTLDIKDQMPDDGNFSKNTARLSLAISLINGLQLTGFVWSIVVRSWKFEQLT